MKVGATLRRSARFLAAPGVVAIGVLCIVPVSYLSAVRPAQQRLEALQRDVAAQRVQGSEVPDHAGLDLPAPVRDLAELYHSFPSVEASPQWLARLFAAARAQGLSLDQGEYRATREKAGRLIRLQITLPVTGEYPSIRRFLMALAADVPAMSLEHVQFERREVGDATVDAKIVLALHLVQRS